MSFLSRNRRKPGFAIIEIFIVIAIILLISFIAFPKLLKQKHDNNQTTAKESLNTINLAMEKYHSLQDPPSYKGANLAVLEKGGFLFDADLGKGRKDGYIFILVVGKGLSPQDYTCVASPQVSEITGTEVYQITESGVVKLERVDGWQVAD